MAARLADVFAIFGGGFLAYHVRFGSLVDMVERYQWMILSGTLLGLIIFSACGVYRSWRGAVRVGLVVRIAHAFAILSGTIFTYLYFTKTGTEFSRLWLFFWLVISFVLSVSIRTLAYPVLNRLRSKGKNRKSVVLVGDYEPCATALRNIRREPSAGFDVIKVRLMDAVGCENLKIADCQTFDPENDSSLQADEIWICFSLSRGSVVESVMKCFRHSTANIRYLPDMQGLRLLNHDISSVAGLYMIDMSCSPLGGWARFLKAMEDKVIALSIILFVSPLLLAVSLAVKMTSPGPVFYRQERMSWNGRAFKMLKFRTMHQDHEQKNLVWGEAASKPMTPIGNWLRRSSLDELPQFINVLKGDMSIVGPRPERVVFVEKFKDEIHGYMQKHMMKAGITGWAQIHGWRGDTDLNKRIEYDLWYIDNWSVWLDLKVIFLTIWRGFFHDNAE
ncbi:undecaprenyl-phosphate glucose phosphotransferase [Chromohalobacter sp. 296-RDG]|uniref:undecaprenyl-phosphate glucose phosphotransferase n=1 Tax=Chromohalobacter sp. 296-RDG TaxID=2994062 RepID=UPI0024687F7D|nr:undecaprenyl-phosphate glucose phosphotransferase [Chromohalobacter sp. 296-RDG]